MKKYTITSLLLLLSFACLAQQLAIEPVISLRKTQARSNFLSIADTLFAYEDYPAFKNISLGLKVNYSLTQRIELSSGLEYFTNGISFAVYNDEECGLCPAKKGWGAFSKTFVLPQQLNYRLYKMRNLRLYGIIGLTPVVNIIDREPIVKPQPGIDFTTGVAEVMNSLPTTIKPFYLDYSLGFKLKYWRINTYFQYQANLSSNTSRALKVYGGYFPFRRNYKSYVFSVGYDLFRIKPAADEVRSK
jgi:hypothetical protein